MHGCLSRLWSPFGSLLGTPKGTIILTTTHINRLMVGVISGLCRGTWGLMEMEASILVRASFNLGLRFRV